LTGLLRYILTPHDQVIQATVVFEYSNKLLPDLIMSGRAPGRMVPEGQQELFFGQKKEEKHQFISEQVKSDYFPFFEDPTRKGVSQKWANRSLNDLIEELVHLYALDQLPGEQANLQAFKDVINDFSKRESGNLHQFVEWWKQFGNKVKLQTAGQRNAIRIMTIHKSKGLEFPIVMIPFCDWSFVPSATKSTILWCSTENKKFNQFPLLPVKYSKRLENSLFSENYFTEMLLSYIDNLNVLYVALTRAVSGLYLFTEAIETKQQSMTISGLLNQVLKGKEENDLWPREVDETVYAFGELTAPKNESEEGHEINLSGIVHQHKAIGSTLRLRENYQDFLDESASGKMLKVNQGKLMHELLSEIKCSEDLESALQKLHREGKIESNQVDGLRDEVADLMANEQAVSWFDGSYKVLNETTIISPAFGLLRPDRVMVDGVNAIVVDYKTTAKENPLHRQQVKAYAEKIKQMGYAHVEGFVWYLKSNKIIDVYCS
jgi:ATP-dependent exoDNAse (exonuclease V) beta subunit